MNQDPAKAAKARALVASLLFIEAGVVVSLALWLVVLTFTTDSFELLPFLVDAVCPNHSRTDMGGADAPRSAEEGAACALWLATREFNAGDTTGVLWEDNQIVEW